MPSPRYGYCCRARLKGYIERECYPAGLLWFSLEENPVGNADSSNPRQLYDLLCRIVAQDDHGHRYLQDLRRGLIDAVRASGRPPNICRKLRQQILLASMDCFQPERLRLDLSWLARRRGCTITGLLDQCRQRAANVMMPPQRLQPDEYLIDSLPFAEIASWCRFL